MGTKKEMVFWAKRRQKIVSLRNGGMSFADIGRKFLMSRERARQIYNAELEKDK